MSGSDQIVINTRERASSSDINDLQSLKDRTLLDSWLEQWQTRTYAIGAVPSEAASSVVLGGLESGPSGNDIAVQAGVLLQDSLTLSPAVGALDSSYRWSALRSSSILTNPAPGADTWYLIEAQMSEIVASSASVDIFDTGTGLFVPTLLDKRTERTIDLQLVAGSATDLPVPSGGDWVVIGGVLVPTGGGAIPAGNFLDMRRLASDLGPALAPAAEAGLRRLYNFTGANTVNNDYTIAAEAFDNINGLRLWFNTDETKLQILAPSLRWIASGENPQTGTKITQVYLATYHGYPVRNAYAWDGFANLNQNALLLWSDTTTDASGERNAATMTLPAPFANYTVPVGEAICIAHIAPLTIPIAVTGTNFQCVQEDNNTALTTTVAAPGAGATAITPPLLSASKAIRYRLEITRDAAGDRSQNILIRDSATSIVLASFQADYQVNSQFYFTVPGLAGPAPFSITTPGTTRPTTYKVQAVGWSL